MNTSRRHALKALTGSALAPLLTAKADADTEGSLPRLRNLAKGRPLIGAALPNNFAKVLSPAALELFKTQFDSVTPENCMKWTSMCPAEGEYRFEPIDRMVALAEANKQKVVGHCLVFNRPGNYPEWLFRDGEKEADAKLVWKRIESHLEKVMTRYKGKIQSWDVLNEFVEVHEPHYRETDFTRVLGEDYPIRLFKMAAELDPAALMTYNDFGIEQENRREEILKFVRKLQKHGCRIDVVGSQSHLEIGREIARQISDTIKRFSAIGVRCAFTELDVDVIPRGKYWNKVTRPEAIKQNPYVDACPEEILQQQTKVYHDLFAAVLANRDSVDRVTLWGITDGHSWLNRWPWKRVNHPLLFDRDGMPKPCFETVAKLLRSAG